MPISDSALVAVRVVGARLIQLVLVVFALCSRPKRLRGVRVSQLESD